MVPVESSPLLLHGGGGGDSCRRRVCGVCRGGLGGGFSERFSFMRLIQQVHDFSAVSHDEDDDNDNEKEDARLGSDRNKVKNNNNQDCRRDNNNNNNNLMADQEEPRTSGSSSKDNNSNNNNNNNSNTNTETDLNQAEMREEGWLRLGIGGQTEAKPDQKTNLDRHQHNGDRVGPSARTTDSSLLELNLFMGGSAVTGRFSNQELELRPPLVNTTSLGSSSLFFNYHHHHHHHHHQESSSSGAAKINIPGLHHHHREEIMGSWPFRPPFVPQNLPSSSANLMMPALMGPYLARSQFHQSQLIGTSSSNYTDVMGMAMAAGPSSGNFIVVDPPRRPHSGLWFVLQASQNQTREPFLPQIPKSYLRIKDGRMTVRVLMKYLVNKLQLEHESEVEIICRGEQLQPALTLQRVRDTIWRRRDSSSLSLLPNSSTSDHLMILHYGRSLL